MFDVLILYTLPHLLSILSHSSIESRHNGELRIFLDCHRLSRDLVEIPFDTPRVSKTLASTMGICLREPISKVAPKYDSLSNSMPVRPVGAYPLPVSPQLKAQALAINMPYHALRDAEFARQRLREFSSGENASLLSTYLNLPELQKYLESPIKWKPQIRLLRRLGAHLAWFEL